MEILQVKPSPFVGTLPAPILCDRLPRQQSLTNASRVPGEVKAKLISWQLANLDQSTKDAAIAYVKTLKPSSSS
jgi:hypothetical protein